MATKQNEAVNTETSEQPMKLEEAMRRLDEVVAALDSEQADLEEALKLYEEGVRLVRVCNERLQEAERTIRVLSVNGDGEITEEPMKAE